MTDWRPIETLPEGQLALVYAPYEPHFCVGKFKWRVEEREELVSSGPKRRTYKVVEERDREWDCENWGATHWMPLPEPPSAPNGDGP